VITYVRLFETADEARGAANELAEAGLRRDTFLLLTGAEGAEEAVAEAVKDGTLPGEYRAASTQALKDGRSVLAIPAPLGWGEYTLQVMDEYGAVDTDTLPERVYRNPSPLSDALGMPVLTDGRWTLFGALVSSDFALSSAFGMKLLSSKATPLSSLFGLKVLSTPKRPWNRSLGLPLLTDKAAPFSSAVGLKTLSEPKRPRTSSFGLPLLSRNPTPLSSFLGLKTLTDESKEGDGDDRT
jgi:hypothetical protein